MSIRLLEAILFASDKPLSEKEIRGFWPQETPLVLHELMAELRKLYQNRGVEIEETHDDKKGVMWAFRTAEDLAPYMQVMKQKNKPLPRSAMETLAVIAYHQPVTRAEIENMRGVALASSTFDMLVDMNLVAPAGRRETPGKPLMWQTTPHFLDHFNLHSIADLPGLKEMQAAGLMSTAMDHEQGEQ